ncbi:hypothetical protein E4T48_05764 [Aureobasidium sp. EXF-10727]|nr:hypothetical protein E4T48_05764 [Aureobasidium sp. EXF-10727]
MQHQPNDIVTLPPDFRLARRLPVSEHDLVYGPNDEIGAYVGHSTLFFLSDLGEDRSSQSSDGSLDGDTLVEVPSPRTPYSGPETTTTRTSIPDEPSNTDSDGFSSTFWNISPEERALMTNSANFARGRRQRRGAIQSDTPLESAPSSSLSSAPSANLSPLASPLGSSWDQDPRNDGNGGITPIFTSPAAPDGSTTSPRGRLQRSFTPLEPDSAGAVSVPGFLRRLRHSCSGPWRGPSSPLTPSSSVDSPPTARLSRLRRFFSCRR